MNTAAALIEQAEHLLREAAALPTDTLTDTEVCDLTARSEAAGRVLDALRVVAAGELAGRSRRELGTEGLAYRHGCTRPAHLIERLTLVSQREAGARIRLADALRDRVALTGEVLPARHPAVADAVRDGRIGTESAARIVDMLDTAADGCADYEALEQAERDLVDLATLHSADALKAALAVWQARLDPDGVRPRDEILRAQRRFTMGRERDGMTPFSGVADPFSAGLLRAAMADSAAPDRTPRFLDPDDLDPADPRLDPRTRDQRQFDTLIGLVTAGLRNPGESGSLRPTALVNIIVTADDLRTGEGVAWIDDIDTPISAFTAHALTCDADTSTIVLGANGEVLHLGRRERLFTAAQRRALAVRDGGCVWPGCTAPPSWCHAHHIVEWSDNGPTDVNNGVLLCPAHHTMLHASTYRLRMIRGKPHLLAPPHIDREQQWRPVGRQRATMRAPATARSR
ncbi:HNH endonuclease signature motif containing protein [Diaminobutyricimonas aerilata]|nr:HNH endonuclease signature motif containing protein [Diaminobutyricimonas aerilata]